MMRYVKLNIPAATVLTFSLAAVAGSDHPDTVYWGDQHVHTGWSTDAGLAGTMVDPEVAVRFALGEAVEFSTDVPMVIQEPAFSSPIWYTPLN